VAFSTESFAETERLFAIAAVWNDRLGPAPMQFQRATRRCRNTHKKNEHWLRANPNVQFHFTPTSASWLNQVEVWFSILQGQSLSGVSFTSLKQLEQHIDAYINAYNDKAQPFVWTKKKVRQRRFKGRRITQL
jgi:hypothetical protein